MIEQSIKHIARMLGIETLESRNNDREDFYNLAVWSIEQALKAAYDAGYKAGQADRTSTRVST